MHTKNVQTELVNTRTTSLLRNRFQHLSIIFVCTKACSKAMYNACINLHFPARTTMLRPRWQWMDCCQYFILKSHNPLSKYGFSGNGCMWPAEVGAAILSRELRKYSDNPRNEDPLVTCMLKLPTYLMTLGLFSKSYHSPLSVKSIRSPVNRCGSWPAQLHNYVAWVYAAYCGWVRVKIHLEWPLRMFLNIHFKLNPSWNQPNASLQLLPVSTWRCIQVLEMLLMTCNLLADTVSIC